MARTNIKPVSESSAKLGAYLQQLRLERRLTMRGLAARAKVDFSYVSRLEHGLVGAPTARQRWKIARALDIEVADLYSEAGFVDAYGLPGFGPYLRAKYQLPDDAVAQLQAHFALINEKYHGIHSGESLIAWVDRCGHAVAGMLQGLSRKASRSAVKTGTSCARAVAM